MPTSISTRTSGSLNPTRQQLDELDALLKRMLELPVNQLEEPEKSEAESEEIADEPPPPVPVDPPQAEQPAVPSPLLPPAEEVESVKGTVPAVSYMVVETASLRPLPPASGFEPRPSALMPSLVPVTPAPEDDAEQEPEPSAPVVPEHEVEGPIEPEVWVPLSSTWQPSPQTWPPLADSWHQANGTAPMPGLQQEALPREILVPQPAATPVPPPIEPMQRSTVLAEQVTRLSQDQTGEMPVPPSAAPTPAEPRLSLTAEDAPVAMPRALLPLLWFNQGFDACMEPLGAVGSWLCGSRGRQTLGLVGLACLAAAAIVVLSAGMAWTW
jgi:hypothetical protein